MAQVNKISSFKSFTEVKNQEATMKLRETNNAKRQETVGKIGSILDEMGLTSLSELDEEKKQALINKMFGNVSEDEADDIEAAINKLGEPKKLKEGNAFGAAVKKAKDAGEKEFEFEGETYKVEEALIAEDSKINYVTITDDLFKADSNWWVKNKINVSSEISNALSGCKIKHVVIDIDKVHESVVNEGRVKAATLLQELVDGNTSRAEGIKMSKDLAEHYLYWLRTSPYGKKNTDLPLYMLIKASFNWGIERGLDPKLKVELDALKASQIKNESVESIDEARSISKIQYDWSKVTTQMQATAQNWKAAEGPAKEMLLGKLKEMTTQKKALEAELDAAIADKDKDLELVVTEAFNRLPKDVIGTELYTANQNLQSFYSRVSAGNDVDPKDLDAIIKLLQQVKSLTKKFNNKEEVLGTVYEAAAKQFDKDIQTLIKDIKSGYGWIDPEYVGDTWENSSDTIDYSLVKGEVLKRLFDAGLLSHADENDEEVAGKKVKFSELGAYANESVVNEAEKFKSTKDFLEFCEEIDGMPEVRIKRIMGKDYIDTPGGYRDEAEDYDNDIEEYMISNMGKSDFNELKTWWENNVAESNNVAENQNPEQLKKLKEIKARQEEQERLKKLQAKRAKVNEAEVQSDEEFKEYAMAVLKKAFGDEFDEAKAGEVVDGILKKCGDDYGACVGMLTSSLGESVITEAFDANYWEDYHEDAPIIKNPSGMQLQQEVEAAVEEWNDNNENGKENEVTPAGEKKVLKLAKEYVKAKGYICHDVIDAMIAQES